MAKNTIDRAPSPAVDRALTILENLVAARSPLTLTALAADAGVPLATCASIMQTFEMRGYATRRVVGRSHFWRPTLKLNGLAAELMRGVDIGQLAQPFLQRLVDETQMAAHVGILEGDIVVYVAKVAAPGMVQYNTYPGKRTPYNVTALGLAMVAYLPGEELAPLLAHMAPGSGPRARRVSAADMRARLAKIRERGYAIEAEEEDAGVGCIAAPILDAGGKVLGSVGVTGFVDQVQGTRLRRNAESVLRAGRLLSQELDPGTAPSPDDSDRPGQGTGSLVPDQRNVATMSARGRTPSPGPSGSRTRRPSLSSGVSRTSSW